MEYTIMNRSSALWAAIVGKASPCGAPDIIFTLWHIHIHTHTLIHTLVDRGCPFGCVAVPASRPHPARGKTVLLSKNDEISVACFQCCELFVSYSGVSILTEIMRPANKRVTQMAVTILTMLSLHSGQHYYPYSYPINYNVKHNSICVQWNPSIVLWLL